MKITKSQLKKIIKEEYNASEYNADEKLAYEALQEYIKNLGLPKEGQELLDLIHTWEEAASIVGM